MSTVQKPIRSYRWILLSIFAVAVLCAVYVVAVWTETGQLFENAALRGADQVNTLDAKEAHEALSVITIWSLGVGTGVIGLIGLIRRQVLLSFLAVGVIFFGQVITQGLKRFILPRPELVETIGDYTGNSFPSGHTTIAMTVVVAAFLVIPYRFRTIAMFFLMTWASGIGAYTLTAKWHRLSDTLGATLIALLLGGIVAVILNSKNRLQRVNSPAKKPRVVLVTITSIFVAVQVVIASFLAVASMQMNMHDPVVEWNIYLAVVSFSVAGALFGSLLYWASWYRIDIVPAGSVKH